MLGLDIGGRGNVLSRPEFQDQDRGQPDTLEVSRLRMAHKPGKTPPDHLALTVLSTALSAQAECSIRS